MLQEDMEQGNAVVKDEQTESSAATAKTKQKKKVITLTKQELQKLEKDFIVQCDPTTAPQRFKAATVLLRCDLCKRHFETAAGAKGHTQEKKHVEKKNLKKVEEELKLVGSPNEEQFDAITVKLQQVYDEWSAEACGQQTVREKIVSDFQEFVQSIEGCEGVVVELFGSTYTGFALKDSDINMNLRFRDRSISDPSSYYHVINAVVERLTTMADNGGDDMVYTDFKNNLYSSVSHITFTHRLSGLSCHVRFGYHHGVPICTGKLLQRYGAVDHRVKVLAVVLKYWAKLCRLDIQELGSYPSQMFVLMLVHFLQHRSPPLLPVPPKPNDFSETQQCLEHFDEYLSGLDHMIKSWKVSNTESLGMLWFNMFRFHCEEPGLGDMVIQITERDLILKKDGSWSTNKLVVLSPVHPSYNMAKACSSQNMYLYLKICFKATMVYFGRNSLNKPSAIPPAKNHNMPQDVTSQEASHDPNTTNVMSQEASHDPCNANVTLKASHDPHTTDVTSQEASHDPSQQASYQEVPLPKASHGLPQEASSQETSHDPCIIEEKTSTVASPIKHANSSFTYLTDTVSQLSDFTDDQPIRSEDDHLDDTDILNQTPNTTTTSHDLDCDVSHDLDCDTSYDVDHDESLDPDYDDASHDLDHDDHVNTSEVETSCEQQNITHLEDSVVVEDIEVNKEEDDSIDNTKYEFISSNFTVKKLPDVCSQCKQEGHIFTSPDCPDREEEIKLAKHPMPTREQLKQLDRVFIDLKNEICLKPEDQKQRRDVCHILEQFIKVIHPKAELMLFGSSANEFGSPKSDIDISMKLPGNYEHDEKAQVIQKVARELKYKRQHHWWSNTVQSITTARVPIVKMQLMRRWNDLECDISLGNYLALHNTELLASYASIDERVQVMGYVLKEFAKSSDMCDASSGSLSSYAYILLLLHYLQQVKPPVIPVLQQIGGGGSVDVDGWNCWFYRFSDLSQLAKVWPHRGKNKKTVGELLINFFKYYLEEFNWQRHVVSIRQLKLLSKLEKHWASKRACIEDPFNLDHNLSSHLSNRMWSYIRNAFKYAHDHITNPQLYSQPVTISTVLSIGFTKNVPQDGLCHTCGKRGHISRNCPGIVNKKQNVTCYHCGKKGHVRSECRMEMSPTEQGDSPDGASVTPPVVSEVKRKRRSRATSKVTEVKTDEPSVTSASPKTKNATAGLLSHPHNREYPPSPVKQSSSQLPEPLMASPPHTTAAQFLPPYPQSHPSVPYTANRHSVHPPPVSPRYNQQPQTRHNMPVPTANVTTRPYLMTAPHGRSPYVNSPPGHHYYPPAMNFMQQQSPPTAYGPSTSDSGGSTTGSYYLFPPPSPATTVSQGGYEDIHTTLKQIVHHQQPQAHNPHTVPVTHAKESGFKAETDHKHKRSKSKTTKPVTEGTVGSNPTSVSLGDIKQGKPAVKVDTNRRQGAVGKGRGRTSRDTSAVGHYGSKHQQST